MIPHVPVFPSIFTGPNSGETPSPGPHHVVPTRGLDRHALADAVRNGEITENVAMGILPALLVDHDNLLQGRTLVLEDADGDEVLKFAKHPERPTQFTGQQVQARIRMSPAGYAPIINGRAAEATANIEGFLKAAICATRGCDPWVVGQVEVSKLRDALASFVLTHESRVAERWNEIPHPHIPLLEHACNTLCSLLRSGAEHDAAPYLLGGTIILGGLFPPAQAISLFFMLPIAYILALGNLPQTPSHQDLKSILAVRLPGLNAAHLDVLVEKLEPHLDSLSLTQITDNIKKCFEQRPPGQLTEELLRRLKPQDWARAALKNLARSPNLSTTPSTLETLIQLALEMRLRFITPEHHYTAGIPEAVQVSLRTEAYRQIATELRKLSRVLVETGQHLGPSSLLDALRGMSTHMQEVQQVLGEQMTQGISTLQLQASAVQDVLGGLVGDLEEITAVDGEVVVPPPSGRGIEPTVVMLPTAQPPKRHQPLPANLQDSPTTTNVEAPPLDVSENSSTLAPAPRLAPIDVQRSKVETTTSLTTLASGALEFLGTLLFGHGAVMADARAVLPDLPSTNQATNRAANQVAAEAEKLVKTFMNGLVFPTEFCRARIQQLIDDNTPDTKQRAQITPDTNITIEYWDFVINPGNLQITQPKSKQITYSVFELAIGLHRPELFGKTTRIHWPESFSNGLQKKLLRVNLQKEYLEKIAEVWSDKKMINLIHKTNEVLIKNALTDFQAGQPNSRYNPIIDAYFEGKALCYTVKSQLNLKTATIRNALFITNGTSSIDVGLLVFFGESSQVIPLPRNFEKRRKVIENTANLKDAVYQRSNLHTQETIKSSDFIYSYSYNHILLFGAPLHPLRFIESSNIYADLSTILVEQLKKDANTLIKTDGEFSAELALRATSALFDIISLFVFMPLKSTSMALRTALSHLFGTLSAVATGSQAAFESTDKEAKQHILAGTIMLATELALGIAPKIMKVVPKGFHRKVLLLLKRKFKLPEKFQLSQYYDTLENGPESAQRFINFNQHMKTHPLPKGVVYDGLVFRGDTRGPTIIFEEGFKLRTQIDNIETVSGVKGGFGGGRNALDPDGQGISTSVFYKQSGMGAYYYGGDKNGFTYLIDARGLEGYHLYANDFLNKYPGKSFRHLKPYEINYGTDIPGDRVLGAYTKDGRFIPNPSALNKIPADLYRYSAIITISGKPTLRSAIKALKDNQRLPTDRAQTEKIAPKLRALLIQELSTLDTAGKFATSNLVAYRNGYKNNAFKGFVFVCADSNQEVVFEEGLNSSNRWQGSITAPQDVPPGKTLYLIDTRNLKHPVPYDPFKLTVPLPKKIHRSLVIGAFENDRFHANDPALSRSVRTSLREAADAQTGQPR